MVYPEHSCTGTSQGNDGKGDGYFKKLVLLHHFYMGKGESLNDVGSRE